MSEQPIDQETGRFSCTAEHPMPTPHAGQWIHRDSKSLDYNDPYFDHYTCPHCGETFKCEVAD